MVIHLSKFFITNLHCTFNFGVIYIPCGYEIEVCTLENDIEYIGTGLSLTKIHLIPLSLYQTSSWSSTLHNFKQIVKPVQHVQGISQLIII